jgi:HEAT repeat protein
LKLTAKQIRRREQMAQETHAVALQANMDVLTSSQLVQLLHEAVGIVEQAATTTLIGRGSEAIDALLEGMKHPSAKVRAACALLLDHVADDRCIQPLLDLIRHDPQEAVRRCALHSLVCDGCKECPLHTDVVGALIETALSDRSVAVKRRAVFYLGQQAPDNRAISMLEALLCSETDPVLLQRARRALAQQQNNITSAC